MSASPEVQDLDAELVVAADSGSSGPSILPATKNQKKWGTIYNANSKSVLTLLLMLKNNSEGKHSIDGRRTHECIVLAVFAIQRQRKLAQFTICDPCRA